MKKPSAKKFTVIGILIGLGIILPFIIINGLSLKQDIFLTMHLPVLIASLTMGWGTGLGVGILLPLLSYIITGIPGENYLIPAAVCELSICGIVSGVLYVIKNKNIYLSIAVSVLSGRVVYIICNVIVLMVLGKIDLFSVWSLLLTGIPGIVIMFLFLPPVSAAVFKSIYGISKKILSNALDSVKNKQNETIIINGNRTVYRTDECGILPLLKVYNNQSYLLKNGIVVNNETGIAAANLFVLCGVSSVYSLKMNKSAKKLLKGKGIFVKYEKLTDGFSNNEYYDADKVVENISSPMEAYKVLEKFLVDKGIDKDEC